MRERYVILWFVLDFGLFWFGSFDDVIVIVFRIFQSSEYPVTKNMNFIWSKLGRKGDYSRARPLCFANQWISRA